MKLPKLPPADLRVATVRGEDDEEWVVLSYPIAVAHLPDGLTPAERHVAELVLRGMTNAQIARARGCAVRTVANHLAKIYRKLQVASRAELAARLGE